MSRNVIKKCQRDDTAFSGTVFWLIFKSYANTKRCRLWDIDRYFWRKCTVLFTGRTLHCPLLYGKEHIFSTSTAVLSSDWLVAQVLPFDWIKVNTRSNLMHRKAGLTVKIRWLCCSAGECSLFWMYCAYDML